MSGSFLNRLATVRQGAYLPHWTLDGAIYHTVFRLADSLPAAVVERHRRERAALLAEADSTDPVIHHRLQELFSERIESHLAAGQGACWLAQAGIAEIIASGLRHFDGTRYRLHAWSVMPNHVHAVVQPIDPHALSAVLHSWKSFTATKANRMLDRSGTFWQKESYDYIVRDAHDLERTIRYVRENPRHAGLQN